MSEYQGPEVPTMPKKIHYTAHADSHGVSRTFGENLSEATGVLDKYVRDGDVSRPHFEHHVESLANEAVARGVKKPYDEIEWRARELLKFRCTDKDTMYPANPKKTQAGNDFYPAQHVYLDLDGIGPATGRYYALPVPSILFATLDPERDRMFKATTTDDEGNIVGGCVAVAVYFDPDKREEDRDVPWNGQVITTASDWDPACYEGVVRTFASFTEMRHARKELIEAIRLIQTPPESDEEPDVFDDESYLQALEDDEFDGI